MIDQLARFIADTTYADVPPDVIERAKWVLCDTVGVTIGGLQEPEVWQLADYAALTQSGAVTLMGHGGKVKPEWAMMVHGTAGTSLEMDEGHAYARGHAAIHAVAPALALAEAHNLNGKETLLAVVLGYEVAARVGVASKLRKGVHPFGAWGVLGAAAIAAKVKDMNAEQIAGVLEVAASYAITPSFNTAYQGANVRNTYAGVVNKLGLMAADLYELGFRGEVGGVETAFGYILGDSLEGSAVTDELGTRYEIMRGYFKPYSGCRYSHATVDALFDLMAESEVDVDTVETIEVSTYDIAATLTEPHPPTPLAGRFSIPHIVASTLTHKSAGPESYTLNALQNPTIRALAERVSVTENPDFTAKTPAQRPASVTLCFKDGSRREKTVMGSKGDPDQPMSSDELQAKYHHLVNPFIGEANAARAWALIHMLEMLPNLNELMSVLGTQLQENG